MSIQTQEVPCRSGTLGVITLDSPATLNALSADMFAHLQEQLDAWAQNDRVCLVLITANGDRGFSAGGDIRELYHTLQDTSGADTMSAIFAREYRVDYTLHTFPKPVISLAHRVIMGGGMGLLQGSRYRLITPNAVLAMPEASIGLFPDVGASWFLNRLPGRIGLFMGLTGARLNASDALRVGLADKVIEREQQEELVHAITEQHWTGAVAADDNRLFRLLDRMKESSPEALPESQLALYEQDIARLCRWDDLPRIVERLVNSERGNDWWNTCIDSLRGACPVSLWLLTEQLKRGLQMSLPDIFRMELAMVTHCGTRPDLLEGIRARIIDRDQEPSWSYQTLNEVPAQYVEDHFEAPWPESEDPLGDL